MVKAMPFRTGWAITTAARKPKKERLLTTQTPFGMTKWEFFRKKSLTAEGVSYRFATLLFVTRSSARSSSGNNLIHRAVTARVPKPPRNAAGTVPNSAAVAPDSN